MDRHRPVFAFNQCCLCGLIAVLWHPDPELMDLIEQAFLEGQIDGLAANLSYLYLVGQDPHKKTCADFDRVIH